MSWAQFENWYESEYGEEPGYYFTFGEITTFIMFNDHLDENFWERLIHNHPDIFLQILDSGFPADWSMLLRLFDEQMLEDILKRLPHIFRIPDYFYRTPFDPSRFVSDEDKFLTLMRWRPSPLGYDRLVEMYQWVIHRNAILPQTYYHIMDTEILETSFLVYLEEKYPGQLNFIPDAVLSILLTDPKSCSLFAKYLPSRVANSEFMDLSSVCSKMPSLTVRSAILVLRNKKYDKQDLIRDIFLFLETRPNTVGRDPVRE